MFETNISMLTDENINIHTNQQSRDQWRRVLGTFEVIKVKNSVSTVKPKKKIMRNKKIHYRTRTMTSKRRKTLQDPNIMDSEIIWSSSSEESDSCMGFAISKYNTTNYKHEVDINCSSLNNIKNEENKSSKQKSSDWRYKKDLKRKQYDFEINWSSSNDSENGENTILTDRLYNDSSCELDSFVKEIEKDLRRTKKLKQHSTIKKGGYVEGFRKAINKAKADTGFLDYEQRMDIICGSKGVIVEKMESYGSYLAKVQVESANCYIILGKNMQSSKEGSAVVCFLDESYCYTVNDKSTYVQPNKVIRV